MPLPVPQPSVFDISPILQAHQVGTQMRQVEEDRARAEDERMTQAIARMAYSADTPERWQQFLGAIQRRFPDADLSAFQDFSSREYAIGQGLTLEGQINRDFAERSYQQGQADRATAAAQADALNRGLTGLVDGQPVPTDGGRGDGTWMLAGSGAHGAGQAEFINAMMPYALEASRRTGIDPRIIIAQAAQETGWGQHAPNNNYFGIKSHGQPGGSTLATTEYQNGAPVSTSDSFRAYGSMGESVAGYADFLLQNPRYRAMMQAEGLDAQLAALGASGYATDPNYAASVGQIARGIALPENAGGVPLTDQQRTLVHALIDGGQTDEALAIIAGAMQPPEPVEPLIINDQIIDRGTGRVLGDYRDDTDAGFAERPLTPTERAAYRIPENDPGVWVMTENGPMNRSGGGVNVNLPGQPSFGTVPAGYARVEDATSPTGFRLVPEPGGEAEGEIRRYEDGVAQATISSIARSNIVLEDIDRAIAMVENSPLLAGWSGQRLLDLGVTGAVDLRSLLTTINSTIGIDRLLELKAASPIGASGFGALTAPELQLLLAQLGSLDQAQSGDQLIRNLRRVRQLYGNVLTGLNTEAQRLGIDPTTIPAAGGPAPPNIRSGTTAPAPNLAAPGATAAPAATAPVAPAAAAGTPVALAPGNVQQLLRDAAAAQNVTPVEGMPVTVDGTPYVFHDGHWWQTQ